MQKRHTLGICGLAVMLGGGGVSMGAPAPEWKADQDHTTTVAGLRSTHTLKRNDYGVGTGSWAATAIVGADVNIDIFLELHR